MRVIAGEFGRRKLIAPKGDITRPTPDRLREALFGILSPEIVGANFTDLYCGSGAVGIEAISRGARSCTFVEKDRSALEALRENLKSLNLSARAEVIAKPVSSVLTQRKWGGIVFVDPPYEATKEYESCLEALGKSDSQLVLIQHDRRLKLPEKVAKLHSFRQLKQGDNWVTFYGLAGA